jgi:hypothetical protein
MTIKFRYRSIHRYVEHLEVNSVHSQQRNERHLQYVACAFSIHKVYIINVVEDEQCKP